MNDNTFTFFFVEIEKNVRVCLPKHMLATGTDKESFTQDVLLKVNENDDFTGHCFRRKFRIHTIQKNC